MAYDEKLAAGVRDLIGDRPGVAEKKMFGGLAFLLNGNMAVGVHGDELIVRLTIEAAEAALGEPGTRPFDITGRPMKGWLMVGFTDRSTVDDVERWVERSFAFASSLPGKQSRAGA